MLKLQPYQLILLKLAKLGGHICWTFCLARLCVIWFVFLNVNNDSRLADSKTGIMKKLIVLSAIVFFSVSTFTVYAAPAPLNINQEKTDKRNGVVMQDGTMYVLKDGTKSEMTKAVIMSNGTKVLANGEVYLKNGDKLMLENGDFVSNGGKIEKGKP